MVAMEPRSYREAIGTALRGLCPHLEVSIVEPEDLEEEAAMIPAGVVIGHLPEPSTDGAGLAWVQFRPYEEPAARIRVGARCWELEQVGLEALLSVIDEAEKGAPRGCDEPAADD